MYTKTFPKKTKIIDISLSREIKECYYDNLKKPFSTYLIICVNYKKPNNEKNESEEKNGDSITIFFTSEK